jgi:hypothetical protein
MNEQPIRNALITFLFIEKIFLIDKIVSFFLN